MNKILLLNRQQIEQKAKRMAYEIWEHNPDAKEVILIGIAPTGYILAEDLAKYLKTISPLKTICYKLAIDKANPHSAKDLHIVEKLDNKSVVLVDDVANSGKTLLYALEPILKQKPVKIEIAVLVNRSHKNFPIVPSIIGQSVSTTLQEHIEIECKNNQLTGAYLK